MSTVSYRRRGSTRKSKGAFPITSQEESNFENNISDTDEEEPEYLAPLTLTSDEEEEEEEEYENGDGDNNEDDDSSLKENDRSILSDRTNNTGKVVTISITPTKQQKAGQTSKDTMKKRRRRRSSARFLSLSGRFHGDVSSSSSSVDNNGDTDLYSSSDPNGSSGSMNGLQATLKENRELGEMYRQAIRMNAENRINAGNSWSLNLIENIDKFLDDDEEDETKNEDDGVTNYLEARRESSQESMMNEVDLARDSLEDSTTGLKRVNFTKASCTIDASVKIYSYRVDDVHLTSYKVLANLNRTDTTGKDSEEDGDKSKRASSKASGLGERKQSERRGMDSTIETRVENINMSKMDSAFDIDPLFHKMSKTFDEGGAKGLLLVNLGVASDSCRIVFDSSEQAASSAAVSDEGKNTISNPMLSTSMSENDTAQDNEEQEEEGEEMDMDEKNSPDETNPMDVSGTSEENERRLMGEEDEFMNNNSLDPIIAPLGECSESNENSVNITCLCDKFRSILGTSSFSEVPFMSQLNTVKEEYAKLESDGYVGLSVPAAPPISKRYGISEKEEREAEEVIHREALERTKMAEINTTSTVVGGIFGTPIASIDDDHDDAGDHNFDMMGSDENDHDFGDESSVSPGMFNETMMSHTFMNESMEIQPSFYNDLNISYNTGVGFTSGNKNNKNQKVVGEGAMAPFNEKGTTARLLDFICNSDNLAPGSSSAVSSAGGEKYEYFDASLLDKFATKDSWMGSTHWKKSDKLVRKTTKKGGSSNNKSSTQSGAGSKSKKNRTFINLFCPANELDAEELLKEASTNTKKKTQRTKKSSKDSDKDLFQLSKATITKQKKLDYLLPPDANIDINELFKLFQRPDARFVSYENCITTGNNSSHEGEIDMDHGHREGFHDIDQQNPNRINFDSNNNFDDHDDDRPGFNILDTDNGDVNDADDFEVKHLDGVRKVSKVEVGYAKVSKKVDVKRLKRDMWYELEQRTGFTENIEPSPTIDAEESNKDNDAGDPVETPEEKSVGEKNDVVSFQDIVNTLDESQGQEDVSIAFYFICVLHLANEKGLAFDSSGCDLKDFRIAKDDGKSALLDMLNMDEAEVRKRRVGTTKKNYADEGCDDDGSIEDDDF